MTTVPQVGQYYRHFKGEVVCVLHLATHTETGARLVVYTDGVEYWARPLDGVKGWNTPERCGDQDVPRFTEVV